MRELLITVRPRQLQLPKETRTRFKLAGVWNVGVELNFHN